MEESYTKLIIISIHRISSEANEGWKYTNSNPILGMSRNEKEA